MQNPSSPLTARAAYAHLQSAGYPRSFIEKLLPDWWDNELLKTSAGTFQFATVIQQRLGLKVSFTDGVLTISTEVPHARFKRRSDTRDEELGISANLGRAIARLAIHTAPRYRPFTNDALELREQILREEAAPTLNLKSLLSFCWNHGVPVLFLKQLPQTAKRMAGMVARVQDRPVIVLGFQHEHTARQLFVLAHELGHLMAGHIDTDGVLIDETLENVVDAIDKTPKGRDSDESQADAIALALLRGENGHIVESLGYQESAANLALKAHELGTKYRIDPGHLILSYGLDRNDWVTANVALNYNPENSGALNTIKRMFGERADLSRISEENQQYLNSAQGIKAE